MSQSEIIPAPAHERFAFDLCFDEGGGIASPAAPRPKRVYHAHEVEALVAQARAEGVAAQHESDEGRRIHAISEIAAAARDGLFALDACIGAHRKLCSDLAYACARAISSAALAKFPEAPLQAALEALSAEVADAPRLVVRTSLEDAGLQALIEDAARDAGFAGQIALRPGHGAQAAFVIEWPDGRADYDPEAVAERVRAALEVALAVDPDHSTQSPPYGEP